MERIAVVGGGGTGHAIAAELTLAGLEVIMYEEPRFKEKIEAILEHGGIELDIAGHQRFAKISRVTTEIEEALEDASIILIAVVALRHEEIAELCASYLRDGQTIIIGPDSGGALVFADILKRKIVKSDVGIAGLGNGFYPCRLVGPAKVMITPSGKTKKPKRIAAFPAKDTNKVLGKLSKLEGIYDFVVGTNVLETALSSSNIVTTVAATLLNAGAIEQSGGEYYIFRQGMTPSVLKCIDAVRRERLALFEALGYTISPTAPSDVLERVARQTEFPELDAFRGQTGPTSMQHRWITEYAPCGLALMVSLGEMIDVPTPVTKALLTLASLMNQTDYLEEGRTVDKLGLNGLSINELNSYLDEGSL